MISGGELPFMKIHFSFQANSYVTFWLLVFKQALLVYIC